MPAVNFPFKEERCVYLEDGTRVLVPRGTLMTVQPTIYFKTTKTSGDHSICIPVGDGFSELDRAAHGRTNEDQELIKLDHLIHSSSAGPLVFSSLMAPDVCWDLLFKTCGEDYISETEDIFIEDIKCYRDGGAARPLIINALATFMYQTVIVREKQLNVAMRIHTSFGDDNRNQEPSMIFEILNFRPELIYGELRDWTEKLWFRCSVWDLFLRHHCAGWSEGDDGEVLLSDLSTAPATTPAFLKKAAPGDAERITLSCMPGYLRA